MRLTLRTMLAYLDKVLEPQDAVDLGKKIEESQFATDLMHRIQDVLRRLRLAAPKVDGRGIGLDANSVAEYLDNTMPAERVADLERVCLESDIHLAEVAACHQILDLVLREPVEVDDRLRARMYALPQRAAELAAQPHHDTPAPQPPSRTPPPLETTTVKMNPPTSATTTVVTVSPDLADKTITRAPAADNSAASHDSTAHGTAAHDAGDHKPRKMEVPEYLKTPPAKKRGNPALALISILAVIVALGVFLTRTEPGRQLISQVMPGGDSTNTAPPVKPENAPAAPTVPTPPTVVPGTSDAPVAPEPPALNSLPATPAAPGTMPAAAPNVPGNSAPGTTTPPPNAQVPATPVPAVMPAAAGTTPAGAVAPLPPAISPPAGTPAVPAAAPPTITPMPGAAPLPGTNPAAPGAAPPAAGPTSNFTPVLPTQPVAPVTQPVAVTPMPVTPPPTPAPAVPTAPPPAVVAMGTVTSTDAVIASASLSGANIWKRLATKAQVSSTDRLLSLPGYRSSIALAYGLNLTLLSATQVELIPPDGRGIPGVVVNYGRLIVAPDGKPNAELRIGGGLKQGQIIFTTGDAVVAFEVRPLRVDGQDPTTTLAPLVVDLYVAQGEIQWTDYTDATGKLVPIKAPARLSLGVPPLADSPEAQSLPLWLTSDDRNEFEKLAAPVVEAETRGDRAITLALKELVNDRRSEVRLLAVRSLMYLDECESLVVALRDVKQERNWDAQIEVLREACALSPASAQRVSKAFEAHYGPTKGSELFRMVSGFSGEQLKAGAAALLVKALDHDDLEFRVVSFFNLRRIAPKMQSSYRPTVTAAGARRPQIVKWEQMLERGELAPKGP